VKYTVGVKGFRYLCDAQEWSFQGCRKWLDTVAAYSTEASKLRVKKVDDLSYGVFDASIGEVMYRQTVLEVD